VLFTLKKAICAARKGRMKALTRESGKESSPNLMTRKKRFQCRYRRGGWGQSVPAPIEEIKRKSSDEKEGAISVTGKKDTASAIAPQGRKPREEKAVVAEGAGELLCPSRTTWGGGKITTRMPSSLTKEQPGNLFYQGRTKPADSKLRGKGEKKEVWLHSSRLEDYRPRAMLLKEGPSLAS